MIGGAILFALATSWTSQVPPPPRAVEERSADLRLARESIRDRENGRLKTLADRLASSNQAAAAAEVRARLDPAPTGDGPTRFVPRPEVVPAAKGFASVDARGESTWRAELKAARDEAADALVLLAGRAAKDERLAIADAALRAVLDRRPDHAEARRLLGYVPHAGGWATPYAVAQLRLGLAPHPKFGWVASSWFDHLDRGELPDPPDPKAVRRWLPADQADALHRPWENAWRFSTEYFEVRTNVPLSEAIAFGRHLEALHDLFVSMMADSIGPELPLARRFAAKGPATWSPKRPLHHAYYFATKDEYVTHLLPREGEGIRLSLGVYLPNTSGKGDLRGASFFYQDEGGQIDVESTLYHEASHQILFESSGRSKYDEHAHYWAVEGLGTYFETLRRLPDGSLEIGGRVGPRMETARARMVDRGEAVPIDRLVAMSKARFNGDAGGDIYLHYCEAMALTVFLMQHDGGRYREPFLDYVRDVYKGRTRRIGSSLDARLGVPYATLDAQFLDFMKAMPRGAGSP